MKQITGMDVPVEVKWDELAQEDGADRYEAGLRRRSRSRQPPGDPLYASPARLTIARERLGMPAPVTPHARLSWEQRLAALIGRDIRAAQGPRPSMSP
jgi:hypothetical protein